MIKHHTRVSSGATFFMKVLFPLLWLGVFGWGTAEMFAHNPTIQWEGGGAPPAWAKWVFTGTLCFAAFFFGRYLMPIKRVELAGKELVISNYLREVRIPLTEVVRVGHSNNITLNDTPLGILELAQDHGFGTEVLFYPRSEESFNYLARLVEAGSS